MIFPKNPCILLIRFGGIFIGRKEEVKTLEKYCASDKNELVAVYGRRRVGKTYLVRETIGDKAGIF